MKLLCLIFALSLIALFSEGYQSETPSFGSSVLGPIFFAICLVSLYVWIERRWSVSRLFLRETPIITPNAEPQTQIDERKAS